MSHGRLENKGNIVIDPDNLPDNLSLTGSGYGGSYDYKVSLDKNSTALGKNIIIEIIEQESGRNMQGGIFLPAESILNTSLLKGKIISIGHDVANLNLNIGDIVMYDKLAAFYSPPEATGTIIIVDIENVIYVIK